MNVNLWFARDRKNEIVGILDSEGENEYHCPICSSKVIPKAKESKKITPHFAHVDVSKCNSESMLHWWFKHKFIERGDTFKIKTDSEIEYTCKDFNTEVTYQLESGTYRPDLVVKTERGQEVIFEMANTNKKKIQDYIDKWIELDKIIVEVDIKALLNVDNVKVFNALYYQGKCFNFNKRDGGYYNTIGKLKEQMKRDGKYDIELVKKLDWFWNYLLSYEQGVSDIKEFSKTIDNLTSTSYKTCSIVNSILKKSSCSTVRNDYKEFKSLDCLVQYEHPTLDEVCDMIPDINKKFNSIDDRFGVKIKPITAPIYESYYHGSRKYMYKYRVVDKNYTFEINFYNKKRKVLSIPVTNKFNKVSDKYNYLDSSTISVISKYRNKCSECNSYFCIEEGELRFFINKNFNLPKRCKLCRQKRKSEKQKG